MQEGALLRIEKESGSTPLSSANALVRFFPLDWLD